MFWPYFWHLWQELDSRCWATGIVQCAFYHGGADLHAWCCCWCSVNFGAKKKIHIMIILAPVIGKIWIFLLLDKNFTKHTRIHETYIVGSGGKVDWYVVLKESMKFSSILLDSLGYNTKRETNNCPDSTRILACGAFVNGHGCGCICAINTIYGHGRGWL